MRQALKENLPESSSEPDEAAVAEKQPGQTPRFSVVTNENGHKVLQHHGLNRHDARAKNVQQKRAFKELVERVQLKAKRLQEKAKKQELRQQLTGVATFDDAVAASQAPQAPQVVPNEG